MHSLIDKAVSTFVLNCLKFYISYLGTGHNSTLLCMCTWVQWTFSVLFSVSLPVCELCHIQLKKYVYCGEVCSHMFLHGGSWTIWSKISAFQETVHITITKTKNIFMNILQWAEKCIKDGEHYQHILWEVKVLINHKLLVLKLQILFIYHTKCNSYVQCTITK